MAAMAQRLARSLLMEAGCAVKRKADLSRPVIGNVGKGGCWDQEVLAAGGTCGVTGACSSSLEWKRYPASESRPMITSMLRRAPGHLVADQLRLLGQAGFADRGADLAQLAPDLLALPRAVAVKPVHR